MQALARCMSEFLQALGVESAFIGGNMAGANLAARFAADYPEKVIGIILCSPVYISDSQAFHARRNLSVYNPIFPDHNGNYLANYWMRANKYGAPLQVAADRVRCMINAGSNSESLHWALYEDVNYQTSFTQIHSPTLIISLGSVPIPFTTEMSRNLIPHAEVVEFPTGTPYFIRMSPQDFSSIILSASILRTLT